MLRNFITLLIFTFTIISCKQNEIVPEYSKFKTDDSQLNYRILYPKNFDKTKSYPLTLFLHGIGERGDNNELQLKYVDKVFLNQNNYTNFQSVVVFPQAPLDDNWSSRLLTKNNIPVMGHLGLLPQSDKTFKFKGKKISERNKILKDAELLQSAGAFSIVLECVETSLSKMVTKKISIPTIGIGASNNCDGQILVFDDLIGLNPINVRFVKKYSNIRKEMTKAVASYAKDVRDKKFPLKKHSY